MVSLLRRYPHNFRLTYPGAIEEVVNKYIVDSADLKRAPTPSLLKQLTRDAQNILDLPCL